MLFKNVKSSNTEGYININHKVYDLVACKYVKKDITIRQFYKDWFDVIVPHFDITKKPNVLELGFGTGQVIKKFCEMGFRTVLRS